MPPVKNPCDMTSYGGITRIRLKGRSLITSSQPALQAPLYLFVRVLYIAGGVCAIGDQHKNKSDDFVNMPIINPDKPPGDHRCTWAGFWRTAQWLHRYDPDLSGQARRPAADACR